MSRGSDSFGYDQANRLKTPSVGGVSSGFVYDGDGKRASKTVGGNTTSYLYDVNASLPVLLEDGERKYVWGLGLAYAVDSSGGTIVYHTDGLGSVRALSDSSGLVVQVYRYDEYGMALVSEGSIDQPFRYTGEQTDEATGLVYLRARYYDVQTGRFVSRDTLPGKIRNTASLHRFAYVGNNPATFIDPSGHDRRAALVDACQRAWGMDYPCDDLVTPEIMRDHYASGSLFSWDDLSSLTEGSPVDKGMFVLVTVGSGGTAGIRILFGHGARHLAGSGLSQTAVESAITQHVRQMASQAELGLSWWGHVVVDGRLIQYRAAEIAQGVYNVGTYYFPLPGKAIVP